MESAYGAKRLQAGLVFHGAIVLLVGMVLGVPYAAAITGGWGDVAVRAWRVAHTGVTAGGVTMLAVAGCVGHVALTPRAASLLFGSMLATGYAFTVALALGAAGGVRGLAPTGPALNLVAFVVSAGAVAAAFVAVVLLAHAARTALARGTV